MAGPPLSAVRADQIGASKVPLHRRRCMQNVC
jgi:hypothetical protein